MRPVIGITCCTEYKENQFFVGRDYVQGVKKAGGLPVILPSCEGDLERLVSKMDGLLLSGGGDIDPMLFGEEPMPLMGDIDPLRDAFELELTRLALDKKIPILGICRGMQVLNVAAGGTICQDISLKIEKPLQHSQQAPRWYSSHSIMVQKETLAAKLLGAGTHKVNSFHHQIIGDLAPGFIVAARSQDGAEEIIECKKTGCHVLGVQFHPENLWRHNQQFFELFSYLVRHSFQEER